MLTVSFKGVKFEVSFENDTWSDEVTVRGLAELCAVKTGVAVQNIKLLGNGGTAYQTIYDEFFSGSFGT
jgi:hypothetical protein